MSTESTLRGAGRVASGSTVAWYRTVEWLLANGPATFEEIEAACAGFVDSGYAKRVYAACLDGKGRSKGASSAPTHPSSVELVKARRWWLQDRLRTGVRDNAVIKHGDQYQALRLPKAPAGLTHDQVTGDPAVARRTVASHNLLVAMKRARARLEAPQGKVTKEERALIVAWLDAHDPHADRAEAP